MMDGPSIDHSILEDAGASVVACELTILTVLPIWHPFIKIALALGI